MEIASTSYESLLEAAPARHVPASMKFYRVQWDKYFPLSMSGSNLQVHYGSYSESVEFMKANFKEIYKDTGESGFLPEEYSDAKGRYYEEMGDFFLFKSAEKQTVGVFIGTPIDWSTYYIRNCSILPSYQGQKLFQSQVLFLLKILKDHRVDRVETDISPSNLGNIHVFNKLQFNVTGMKLSERWGTLIHFTKYLSRVHENIFLDQFCHGVRPQVQKTL